MASSDDLPTPDSVKEFVPTTKQIENPGTPTTIDRNGAPNGIAKGPHAGPNTSTPVRIKRSSTSSTPRFKKKVPWKGKNILVLLPRDDNRGQPGESPMPLSEANVSGMLRSWQQLGYDISGFDLYEPIIELDTNEQSQSRGAWPDPEDLVKERRQGDWKVLLPDLNAWKRYVEELNEAKLRALGVSFGDEEPPLPSISPASANSRQPSSAAQYPPLPFSPPIPTSSAGSNQAVVGFPFPGQFVTSASQSPGIPAGASPGPFGKYNPRASISVSSPLAWSPQMMLQHGHRGGSPSLANLGAIMSPTSPFSPDGIPGHVAHQRHQSLQYPSLPHQFQPPVRASPRLQELREVDEETAAVEVPPTKPEQGFVSHNPSDSLQREIDEAEYHLEEQMRSQLDNDQDYSPHNDNGQPEAGAGGATAGERLPEFNSQSHRFAGDADGLVLHHPRPHSRGHSLSQKYFTEDDASNKNGFKPTLQQISQPAEEDEIETNPSNLGTPVQALEFPKLAAHQRAFSNGSNPWLGSDSGGSAKGGHNARPSQGSVSSFSKLNVEAPEFKFNPTSTFNPGAFSFSSNTFQPSAFNAGVNPVGPAQSVPSTVTSTSKINANAPVFSPGQSEFSFSASGPKFRPDAPSFTPQSMPTSVASPVMSGADTGSNRNSIFGTIDLSSADHGKFGKKSTKPAAVVVPPVNEPSPALNGAQYDAEGRPLVDESRIKRARANVGDGDDVPLFADPHEEETLVLPSHTESSVQDDGIPAEEKSFDDSNLGTGDMTMSSTMVSETTDTKATVSPSEPSVDHATLTWAPFEFNNNSEAQAFNEAKPFESDERFKPGHKKSLSATANAFVPGAATWVNTHLQEADATPPVADDLADKPVERSVTPEAGFVAELEAPAPIEKVLESAAEDDEESAESVGTPVESERTPSAPPVAELAATTPSPVASPSPAHAKGLSASRYAQQPPSSPPVKRSGLAASRFAAPPSPMEETEPAPVERAVSPLSDHEEPVVAHVEPDHEEPEHLVSHAEPPTGNVAVDADAGPSMADIDEVMRLMNEDPDMGVNRTYDEEHEVQWGESSPTRPSPLVVGDSSPTRLLPPSYARSDAPSPSQADYDHQPATDLEDPFVDPSRSGQSVEGAVRHLNVGESLPASDWEGMFSESEQTKLESRVAFFDGRVNELVGGLLAARLGPLERTLDSINLSLLKRTASNRRDQGGSVSAEVRESDADDEDDEVTAPPRSMSPRRDRRLDQIRAAVLDAFATQRRNQPTEARSLDATPADSSPLVLKALEEMKEHFARPAEPAFAASDIKSIVEEVVERRVPLPPSTTDKDEQLGALQARVAELEQQLRAEQTKVETESATRRAAEDRAAEADRELHATVAKFDAEVVNKNALIQVVNDMQDRIQAAEDHAEDQVEGRRAAEDRLSEVQRLLRISSEEETRLRELVDDKDQKIHAAETVHTEHVMRLNVLEASQANASQLQSEAQNRVNALEAEAREARKETAHWRSETDRIVTIIQRRDRDLAQALDENKAMHKLIDTLGTQLQENERMRDTLRSKFISIQEEMGQAAKQITEESSRRVKKEQALLARQEVLEARLQAEARTRERIETELERLEMGERQGMRAVSECKRLEGLLAELRTENHTLHQNSLRYQAEFQEARESGAREVQRTRDAMQAEVEEANHQVNVAREELEDEMSKLRAQLDQVKLDADTAKARHEMLLEEAQNSKQAGHEELVRKHQNEVEDLQARYERQLNNTTEDAQRAEQNLLERLSISTSKSEYLQDKVAHLEDKLEIAKEAARAAALAAKSVVPGPEPAATSTQPRPAASGGASRSLDLPEKISPQALRESIMVLQEQLQEREHRIEDLESKLSKLDPDAETKISKRDDEIIWLRELLAVRHSDLQDIIGALGRDDYDKNAVKDAAIRLKANLQMEEQERERAMNGGSAISLPNIAATIQAATPRVAQAVGPFAAAWGNWRKNRDLSSVLSSPAPRNSTPSKVSRTPSSLLGNNNTNNPMTPPSSHMRQTPTAAAVQARQYQQQPQQLQQQQQQPSAFSNTGRRFTAQDLANRPRPPPLSASPSLSDKARGKAPATMATMTAAAMAAAAEQQPETPPQRRLADPVTPPMMRSSAYDDDAQAAEEFDDTGFFED
ncbi:hypothetical protein B0J18DRAFT_407545 [Chaetomium sp. MPI-SDFR-AT-0129]|nr:hypothetical protein B0J18DRAFT_407545 [Chaetomium sp. MPI-SDFR-AT-0129]